MGRTPGQSIKVCGRLSSFKSTTLTISGKKKKFPKNFDLIRKVDVLRYHDNSHCPVRQWDSKFKEGDLSQALETWGTSERGIKSLSVVEKI